MKIAQGEQTKTPDYDAAGVHQGLFYAITCHRKEIDPTEAATAVHGIAGTSGGWTYVEKGDLPDEWWEGSAAYAGRDTPYPQPCFDHPETHVHTLAEC